MILAPRVTTIRGLPHTAAARVKALETHSRFGLGEKESGKPNVI